MFSILFSGKKGIGKSILAYHLVNYLFSLDEINKYDSVNFKINHNETKTFPYDGHKYIFNKNDIQHSNLNISKP